MYRVPSCRKMKKLNWRHCGIILTGKERDFQSIYRAQWQKGTGVPGRKYGRYCDYGYSDARNEWN